jgi:hypothetical protein
MDSIDQLSEIIERAALVSLHECCPEDVKQQLGLDLVECEDSVSACSSQDPSILINRVLGLGTLKDVTIESIETISSIYKDRNIANYFLHIYEESVTPKVADFLRELGFAKKRGWMKFRSGTPQPKQAATNLRVEKVGLDRSHDFGTIVCGAFGMQPTSVPLLAGIAADDRWHLFVSYDGDTPAGAGALFVEGNAGWLEWGATHPDFRSRGSQASIMASRLNLAAELGCDHVFTETGEAVDGDPQHSYKNILKAGFEESVLRLNFAPIAA